MSLRNKITQAVDKAFLSVGDIAEEVILSKKTEGEYDLATSTASATYVETSVKAIIISVKQKADDAEILAPRKEVYVKEFDLPEPALYDTVKISGVSHTIINITHEIGLITLLVTEG